METDHGSLDELPARLVQLEPQAFEEFAASLGPRLHRLFRRRGLSEADAEALAVSCLTDITLKVHRFHSTGPGSFEHWVFTLARNACVDLMRRQGRLVRLDEELAWPTAADWGGPPPAVQEALQAALQDLSEVDRTIVQLHQIEELPFPEIGARVNLSEGAARVRHHRALKRLAERLEHHPEVLAWRGMSSPAVSEEGGAS